VIRRTELGNEVAQLLLSSNCAFQVPPYVNDIAAAMPWLLESAPIPLSYCYKSIAINLRLVCDIHGDNHIPLFAAHLKILQVCYTVLLHCFYPDTVWERAEATVLSYLPERWGGKIHIDGLQHVLQEVYYYIQYQFGFGVLYFPVDDQLPLLCSSLTTRHSSYPTWVLVVSSPFPHVIRRTELGNEVAQLLLSSNRGFEVPPYKMILLQ